MAYSFRFKAVETDTVTASASWKLPVVLNNPGTWTIGIGGEDTKKRDGERKASLLISFEDLHGTECTDAPPQAGRIRSMKYPITGEIGVYEVIAQYLALLDRAKDDQERDEGNGVGEEDEGKPRKLFAKTDAYVDTIIFTTTLKGSATPS